MPAPIAWPSVTTCQPWPSAVTRTVSPAAKNCLAFRSDWRRVAPAATLRPSVRPTASIGSDTAAPGAAAMSTSAWPSWPPSSTVPAASAVFRTVACA